MEHGVLTPGVPLILALEVVQASGSPGSMSHLVLKAGKRIIGIRRLQKSKYSNNKTGKALLHKETSHTAFRILHMLSTDQHRPAHSDALLIGYQLPYHVAFRADQLEI